MGKLDGKVAVLSGGAQGIGEACALRLAAEGAKVVIGDLREGDSTANAITEAGGEAVQVALDVRVQEDWRRVADEAVTRFGRIDLLANVAGVVNNFGPDNVLELTEEGWNSVIDTDLKGVWLGMQACIPHVQKAGGGSIVNVASTAAHDGLLNLASYSAAKAGVLGLTRQAAHDYGADSIRVNAICPAVIDTPILGDVTPEMVQLFTAKQVIKRLGKGEDVAGMMTYLMSDDASLVTGQAMNCDGGFTIT